tara:strand:- start:542 stop:772 length:231 start_codon:yes stop_codon:yes gene_type:complete
MPNPVRQISGNDKRPALAFDSAKEVSTIVDSLNAYRLTHVLEQPTIDSRGMSQDEFIRKLIDELEIVYKMFQIKEK